MKQRMRKIKLIEYQWITIAIQMLILYATLFSMAIVSIVYFIHYPIMRCILVIVVGIYFSIKANKIKDYIFIK